MADSGNGKRLSVVSLSGGNLLAFHPYVHKAFKGTLELSTNITFGYQILTSYMDTIPIKNVAVLSL